MIKASIEGRNLASCCLYRLYDEYTDPTAPFIFKIITNKADTIVAFDSHWGVLVDPQIKMNANMTVDGAQIEIEYDDATE